MKTLKRVIEEENLQIKKNQQNRWNKTKNQTQANKININKHT